MKTIKIMIAASEEMHEEKLEFTNLIEHLNEVLEPRGVELKRIKWNPETDGSIDEFKSKLKECEMCLTLYWRDLAGNSEQELNTAYQELKDGNNPRNLYVFFKEPTEDLTEALRNFKANFVTNYGHFFCKFENVDTMNLHFILQFEAYQNQPQQDKLIQVIDEKVMVADKEIVNLNNIPFASMNKEYQRLQKELAEIDNRVSETRTRFKADPDNEDIEDELMAIKIERKKIADEFGNYQKHLYDIALTFAKQSGERYSERMRKAREQFEMGNAIEADQILNMEEMKREAQQELKQFHQNNLNLEIKIEEFRLKADTVMANAILPVLDRFAEACEAFDEAIEIARQIHWDKNRFLVLLFDYARFLMCYEKPGDSIIYLKEALTIIRDSKDSMQNEDYFVGLSRVLNNLGLAHRELFMYDDSLKEFEESLETCRALMIIDPDYIFDLINSLQNIAGLFYEKEMYDIAEEKALELLELCKELENGDDRTASGLNLIGMIHEEQGDNDKAFHEYQQAKDIRKELAKTNPSEYLPELANTINNLADLYTSLETYDEARANYEEALSIREKLAEENPITYSKDVAHTIANIARLDCATQSYSESIEDYYKALRILENLKKQGFAVQRELINVYYGIAFSCYKMGKYESALLYFNYCKEEYYGTLQHTESFFDKLIEVINHMASIYEATNEYEKAIREYKEAKCLCDKHLQKDTEEYFRTVVLLCKNIGVQYDNLEMYENALEYYEESLNYAYELYSLNPNTKALLAIILMLTGLAHHQLSHFNTALSIYNESLQLFNELPDDVKEENSENIETIVECIKDINSQL